MNSPAARRRRRDISLASGSRSSTEGDTMNRPMLSRLGAACGIVFPIAMFLAVGNGNHFAPWRAVAAALPALDPRHEHRPGPTQPEHTTTHRILDVTQRAGRGRPPPRSPSWLIDPDESCAPLGFAGLVCLLEPGR